MKNPETLVDPKIQISKIFRALEPLYGNDPIEINYHTPFQLVVATILSAQCTDKRVNMVTAAFFDYLKTPEDYLALTQAELEKLIKPAGFFRNKAKNIRGAAHAISSEFGGVIPSTLKKLVQLPGFGRKTANVVLGALYNRHEGIVVDTHVLRLSIRLGLSSAKQAHKVETGLMAATPKKDWGRLPHLLILHGRRVCHARKPVCSTCIISRHCLYFRKFFRQKGQG